MKKILLILALISMIIFPVFSQTGTYTTNEYFYLPLYGAYGTDEFDEYNTYMQVADTQIEANKVMGEASIDTSGTPVQYDIARFTDADTIEGRSYAEMKADLDLEIGTDVEAHDDGLLSIAGLTTAANKSIYTTALDTYAVYDLTAFARTILNDADASAVRTTIDALQDVANAIDSDHYTDASIDHEHLAPDVISGITDVTSADADYILIWDATDSALKKCDMAEVRGGGGATAWDDIGNPDANDEIDFGAFVIELNVENFQIGDGGANYIDFNGGNMTFAGTADIDLPNNSVDSGDLNFNFATSSSEGGEATTFNCTDNENEALACPLIFVDGATGAQGAETDDTDFTYNPSTGTLKVTALDLTTALPDAEVANNITIDLATLATTITVTDNEATAENNPICFVAGADPDGGSLGIETDGDLHYNPSTGLLTSTGFAGALTGNVTGNATGLVSTSNADITIQPNGTGDTIIYAPSDVVTTKTAVATLTIAEAGTVLVSCAATPYTITLPTASGHTGLRYHFIKTDANYFLITLDGHGVETFNYENSTSAPVATYARLNTYCAEVTIVSDGTNWQVIDEALGQVPQARVYLGTTQANMRQATWTIVALDTEVSDIGSNFDHSLWISGSATATSAFHLVDTTNNQFTAAMVGYKIRNTTDATETVIQIYNSTSDVTVSDDIFVNGENYEVYNAKFVCPIPGRYFAYASIGYSSVIADKRYYCGIYNGSTGLATPTQHAASTDNMYVIGLTEAGCSKDDELLLKAYNTSAVNTVDIYAVASTTYIDIKLVSKD